MNFVEKNVWGGWYVTFLPPPHLSANEEGEEGNFGVIKTILCLPSVHPHHHSPHPPLMFWGWFFFLGWHSVLLKLKLPLFLLHEISWIHYYELGSPSFTNWVLSGISVFGEPIPQPLLHAWVPTLPDVGLSPTIQKRPRTTLRRKSMAGNSRSPEEKKGGVSRATRQLRTWTKAENLEY